MCIRDRTQSKQIPLVERSQVTPEYFHLLEIPVLRGRLFNDGDDENAPQVAVINQAMAETYWRGEDPLGKRLKLGNGRPGAVSYTHLITCEGSGALGNRFFGPAKLTNHRGNSDFSNAPKFASTYVKTLHDDS